MKWMYIMSSHCYLQRMRQINNKHVICQLYSMQLQKEVKSNPIQPSCKKKCALPRMLL